MMIKTSTLTGEKLKKVLEYNPDTGEFIRLTGKGGKNINSIAGGLTSDGYISIRVNHVLYQAHRLAFLYMTGSFPDQVDHINHHRTDNRWCNLRASYHHENQMNRGMQANNTSGITGVNLFKRTGKWKAEIKFGGKRHHLGYFDNKKDAENARIEAEKKFGFHPNHGKMCL